MTAIKHFDIFFKFKINIELFYLQIRLNYIDVKLSETVFSKVFLQNGVVKDGDI